MEPSTITLKNLPPELHKVLSERAKRNHRSLNGEILATLQASVEFVPDVAEIIAEADRFVDTLRFTTTSVDIGRMRKAGRR
jgi:plasmid stability protein